MTDREKCRVCGKCEAACLGNYRTVVGRDYTVDELVKICLQDLMFYEESGGGVTLSGGEVMAMDSGYIKELVRKLHREGVSVAIDTCGQAPYSNYEAIIPYVDTWLYDIKVMDDDKHREYMGMGNALILDNLRRLAAAGARIGQCAHTGQPQAARGGRRKDIHPDTCSKRGQRRHGIDGSYHRIPERKRYTAASGKPSAVSQYRLA